MEADQYVAAGLTLRFDSGTRTLVATVAPDADATPMDESSLQKLLHDQGYGGMQYLTSAGTTLVEHYNAGKETTLTIARCVDGTFRLAMASGSLEASLQIQPAQGGAPVTIGAVMSALAESKIKHGILTSAIEDAIATQRTDSVVIARGRPCVHGIDGHVESRLPEVRSRAPKVDESGQIDYRDLGEILVVRPGDPLMLRHAPTKGEDGWTLRGERIPAKPGKVVMYSGNLPGTAYDPADPNLLTAAIEGQPVLVAGGMIVEPIFKIKEVNIASGNIDFDGCVVVEGDVQVGMTVHAGGDIEIGGVADMAILEAGGSIVIKGGAIGNLGQKEGECSVRCGGCFTAKFVQQTRVEAGDSIFIDDVAMQSELSATNHIRVGNEGRGQIVGGTIQAALSITAMVIGSPNHVRTRLNIGLNPAMYQQMRAISKSREDAETRLAEVAKLLDFAHQNPGKLRAEIIDKTKSTADDLSATIEKLREDESIFTKKVELSEGAIVIAQQTLYEGVDVFMGKLHHKVIGKHGPVSIGPSNDGLELALRDA